MEFVLPKLDHTMEEGAVAAWLAKAGDKVSKGQPIVSIETNKSILDVESPVSGTIAQIVAEAGETVPVFGVLAIIE